jgi:hypothetical protein
MRGNAPGALAGWRGLGAFWIGILVVLGGGAGVLQYLGPPPTPPRATARVPPMPAAPPASNPASGTVPPVVTAKASPADAIPVDQRPGRDTPGPIADPDPALLEPAADGSSGMLPRIADDGRMPMQVYAAGFDRTTRRPRIGLLVAGYGLNEADSARAATDLPHGVSFAVSPYAGNPDSLLAEARLGDHEYLLSIPMEPQSFPLNDPGQRALMTTLTPEDNLKRLNWVLARIGGYVGVTGALGAMRGERFAGVTEQMNGVLAELGRRGLLYVDARPAGSGGAPTQPHVWSRDVDLVVDEPVTDIDAKLAELEHIARDKGSALGLAGSPRPVAVQHVVLWANGLMDRGLALAPVSALALPPADTKGKP